jgi:hypothetical protein
MPRLLSLCARLQGLFFAFVILVAIPASAQDASTGAIRGTVVDSSGRRIVDASIALVDSAQGFRYFVTSDSAGQFVFEFLPPGEYAARAVAPDMSPQVTPPLHVDAGATTELNFNLQVGGAKEMVTVAGEPPLVDTQSHAVSSLIDKRAIEELPLDGRRFTDFGLWRNSGLSVQLSGRWRRQQQRLLRPGPRPISRSLPVLQRSRAGVPRLIEHLRRGTGTSRRRGDQRGHEVRVEPTPRNRFLFHS